MHICFAVPEERVKPVLPRSLPERSTVNIPRMAAPVMNVRPVKELMTRFVTCDSDLINDHTYSYLRDLEGLVTQALEAIEIYYTMLSDQQNSYNATISNNVNDVMKVLTIFSAIFIPLTFIVGVYGMNFDYIPFLRYRYAYFILWGIMIAIVILMLFFFKRKRWF